VNLGGSVSKIVPCTSAIAPASQNFGPAGGSGSVTVMGGTGCAWTAVSNAAWIHVTVGSSGSGNGSVGYSVDANTSTSARTGTMTIAGKTFTLFQSGAAACTYSITPSKATFSSVGGSNNVEVAAGTGCAGSAGSNASWITAGASGSGDRTVTYAVATYTGHPKNRTGTVTIAGQTFTVKQSKYRRGPDSLGPAKRLPRREGASLL